MVGFARKLGLDWTALQTFAKCLNSPPPMTRNSYDYLFVKYSDATKSLAEDSMKRERPTKMLQNEYEKFDLHEKKKLIEVQLHLL